MAIAQNSHDPIPLHKNGLGGPVWMSELRLINYERGSFSGVIFCHKYFSTSFTKT